MLLGLFLVGTVTAVSVTRILTTDSGWSSTSKGYGGGEKILTKNYPVWITNVTKASSTTATRTLILDTSFNIIANTTNLVGSTFIFEEPFKLNSSTYYYIIFDKVGVSYTFNYKGASGGYGFDLVDIIVSNSADDCVYGTSCLDGTTNIHMLVSIGVSNISSYEPSILLNSPEDYFNSSISIVTFNFTGYVRNEGNI